MQAHRGVSSLSIDTPFSESREIFSEKHKFLAKKIKFSNTKKKRNFNKPICEHTINLKKAEGSVKFVFMSKRPKIRSWS